MGCSESTEVLESANRSKPSFNVAEKVEPSQKKFFVMGEVQKAKYVWAHIDAKNGSIKQLQLPANFEPKNYSSMVSIGENTYFISGGTNYSLNVISSECFIFNTKENSITPVKKMKQERYTHASLYYEGWLYVFGGRHFGDDDSAILAKCEKYSLSEKEWITMPDMKVQRCTFFTLVWNERIYVLGGYTGECKRSRLIEYMEIGKGKQWITLDVQLNRGVESGFLLSANTNEVTIFGGNTNSGASDTVVSINFQELTARSNKKLQNKKILHKGEYNDGKAYLYGGNEKLTVEEYDLNNLKSVVKDIGLKKYFTGEQFEALTHPESTVIVPYQQKPVEKIQSQYTDQTVYIFGTTQEPFILQLNISVPYAAYHSVPLSLTLHALQGGISLQNKQFLFYGGISDSLDDVSSETYLYDHEQRKANRLPDMHTSRYAFSYTMLNGWAYALGGGSSDQEGELMFLKECQKFSLQEKKWVKMRDLPVGLVSSMCLNYKQKIYLFGGIQNKKERYKNILRYNQEGDEWVPLQFSFPFGLEAGSIHHNNEDQFLIFGGRTVNGDSKGIWSLTFIEKGENCVFVEKGQMNEGKCLHKIYQPNHQNFLVIFGGEKYPLSYYERESLKALESDILAGMKEVFEQNLSMLHHRSLQNYLILAKGE